MDINTELLTVSKLIKEMKQRRKREAELRAKDKELAERKEKEAHLNEYKIRWARKTSRQI